MTQPTQNEHAREGGAAAAKPTRDESDYATIGEQKTFIASLNAALKTSGAANEPYIHNSLDGSAEHHAHTHTDLNTSPIKADQSIKASKPKAHTLSDTIGFIFWLCIPIIGWFVLANRYVRVMDDEILTCRLNGEKKIIESAGLHYLPYASDLKLSNKYAAFTSSTIRQIIVLPDQPIECTIGENIFLLGEGKWHLPRHATTKKITWNSRIGPYTLIQVEANSGFVYENPQNKVIYCESGIHLVCLSSHKATHFPTTLFCHAVTEKKRDDRGIQSNSERDYHLTFNTRSHHNKIGAKLILTFQVTDPIRFYAISNMDMSSVKYLSKSAMDEINGTAREALDSIFRNPYWQTVVDNERSAALQGQPPHPSEAYAEMASQEREPIPHNSESERQKHIQKAKQEVMGAIKDKAERFVLTILDVMLGNIGLPENEQIKALAERELDLKAKATLERAETTNQTKSNEKLASAKADADVADIQAATEKKRADAELDHETGKLELEEKRAALQAKTNGERMGAELTAIANVLKVNCSGEDGEQPITHQTLLEFYKHVVAGRAIESLSAGNATLHLGAHTTGSALVDLGLLANHQHDAERQQPRMVPA